MGDANHQMMHFFVSLCFPASDPQINLVECRNLSDHSYGFAVDMSPAHHERGLHSVYHWLCRHLDLDECLALPVACCSHLFRDLVILSSSFMLLVVI